MIATSLMAGSAYLYQAVTLQSQTVSYALHAEQFRQYAYGMLTYALALLATHGDRKQALGCDVFNTQADGFVRGTIQYTKAANGYTIQGKITRSGDPLGGFRARIKRQMIGQRVTYSCVAFEIF